MLPSNRVSRISIQLIPAVMRSEVLLGRIGVIADVQYVDQVIVVVHCLKQCGITCGAIDEASRSS